MNEAQIQGIMQGQAVSSDSTYAEQGYGFGLVLVKHLVESLKGKLEITSSLGKGTTFSITMP